MKKNLLFKMLAVLIVLITSINTAWADKKTIYLVPGTWNQSAGEKYWVHTWGGTKDDDQQLKLVDGQSGIYSASVNSDNNNYQFTRCSSASESVYDHEWDRTSAISDGSHNCCEITGWNDADYNMCDIDLSATTTVYYTYTGSSTLKVNVNLCGTAGVWRLINMTNTGKTYDGKAMYSAEIPVYFGGLKDLQFVEGESYLSKFNTWTSTSVFGGKIYYSNKWKNMGIKRTYDGNTYIYWKISGNDIPDTWDDSGSGSHAIQMLSISNGNYVYTGFNSGEELEGSNFVRYLVPAGDYADCLELRDKNNNYSSEYGFPAESEDNEIWNFKTDGSKIQWAQTYFAKDAYVYFDNTNSSWSTASGYNYLLAGGGGYSALYGMSPISDTKLLCHTSSWSYNDFLQLVFIHTGNEWSGNSGNPNDRKGSADYRTASLPKMMDHSTNLYNLYIPSDAGAKASTEASLTHSANSSYSALLNADQTINTVVKTTGSYTSANSKAPISLGSYYLNSATTSTSSSASLTTGESTDKVTACKTATTTFTVDESNMATGYQFDGWFAAATGGSALETNATYSYATNGAKTVYARFSAINYNVTYSAPTNGNYTIKVADGTASSATKTAIIGQTITLAAIPNAGYALQSWTVTKEGGGTVEVTDNTFTMPAENVTVTAAFYVRYGLYGSLDADGNPTNGMPGWSESQSFTYSDGTYTTSVSLDKPNSIYKFRILDRRDNTSWGLSSKAVISENTATTLDNTAADAQLATAGRGSYTLTVVENGSPTHPRVTISNPTSYLVTLGVKSVNDDGSDAGDLGGTVTATDAAGNTYTSGQYIANGETVTVEATDIPTGYHFVGWWSSSAYSGGAFSTENPASWTVDGAVNAYVKFIEDTNTFSASSGNNWNTVANWSAEHVPAITDVVYITAPVTVDIANAKAKRVYIDQSSAKTGKLTVGAGKALVVAATIQKINSSSEIVATEETDIVLESDGSNGTGALIAGSESTDTKATVQFYTLACKNESDKYVNQYFGPAFVSAPKINYYGAYLRTYSQSLDQWISFSPEENTLTMFNAYRIMRDSKDDGETYNVSGTLYLPGTGEHKTKELLLYNNADHDNDNMFSNSYTAPIDITNMTASDFVGATATIYIFNAGSKADAESHGETTANKGRTAGQWLAIPIEAPAVDPAAYDVILPSQQAFLVQADGKSGTHTLTLDYDKHVYTPALSSVTITPTHAPKRQTEENAKDVEIMHIYVNADESNLGDRLYIYMSDDFKAGEMDNGWEGYKMSAAANVPQLCAFSDLGEMSIMALPSAEGTVLGFYAGTEDDHYTFTFDYEGTGTWYLNDLDENESTVIDSANEYQFTATKGTVAEKRFTVSKTPIHKTPTGIEDVDGGVNARKLMMNGTLYIIRDGRIYNAEGSLVK